MKPRIAIPVLIALLAAPALADEASDLVQATIDQTMKKPSTAKLLLESGNDTRDLTMIRKRFEDADRVRIDVLSPYQYKGMRYFFADARAGHDSHHVYLPALRRTQRIAEAHRNQPFLATSFDVEDMIPPNFESYTYRFVGDAEVLGRACKLVERVAVDADSSRYSRAVLAIDPADHVVVRTEFFDDGETPLKTWTVEKLERIDEVWTPVEQRMKEANAGDWKLVVTEIEYDTELRLDDFAPVGLGR